MAGVGPELLSLGVAGVEGVAEPDPKLYVKALGVVGVGGADTLNPFCSLGALTSKIFWLESFFSRVGGVVGETRALSTSDTFDAEDTNDSRADPFGVEGSFAGGVMTVLSITFGAAEVLSERPLVGDGTASDCSDFTEAGEGGAVVSVTLEDLLNRTGLSGEGGSLGTLGLCSSLSEGAGSGVGSGVTSRETGSKLGIE